jgi:Homeodomain-like domain
VSLGLGLAVNLNRLRLDQLQEAIRSNEVSFPAQVPVFIKHSAGKQQCHMVLLYFVRGWSCDRIAKRYNVTRQHIWQIVSEWRRHAVALGYLQVIPPAEVLRPLHTEPLHVPARATREVLPPAAAEAEALVLN